MQYLTLLVVGTLATVSVRTDYPFRNVSLPWDQRVDDLVSRLTLEELTFQMARGGGGGKAGPAPAIPRLGIKPYQWNTECLRGVMTAGEATAFPMSIGLGAAFSWRLIAEVSTAIGSEVRAKYNNNTRHGDYSDHRGVTCFSPMVNIMRHPLWGRIQEVYGEDPYLIGRYASEYVQGLQGYGKDPRYIMASSTCKAYDAYAGPEDIPVSRLTFDAKISDRDLHLTFLPAYRYCVDAGTYSFMCSYNSINGVPVCANRKLLQDILRTSWGFKGYVISDMGAIEAIVQYHKYIKNTLDTVVATVEAGCNLELSLDLRFPFYAYIAEAVALGKLKEEKIREMVKPLFYTRMRIGEFDPPEMNPYSMYDVSIVQSRQHRKLAITAASKSFVLLKNMNQLLPLRKKFGKIGVVGPMADNLEEIFGNYSPDIDPQYCQTPLQGLSRIGAKIQFAPGCSEPKCSDYDSERIKAAVSGTQLNVVCLGTGISIENEGTDRVNMSLPGQQEQLLRDVIRYGSDIPILLLLFSAGPVNISFADADPHISAIMQCFFPAQAAGAAVYNVLTLHEPESSPAGRLPYTWYNTSDQIPSMVNYTMVGRSYRYFNGDPLYPFGYGLSYTTFKYTDLSVTPQINAGQTVNVSVHVQNVGTIDSDEVVQVYIQWLTTSYKMPRLQLVAFDRVFIKAGAMATVDFTIEPRQLAVWTDSKGFVIESGNLMVYCGGQQPFQERKVPSNILQQKLTIVGMEILGV